MPDQATELRKLVLHSTRETAASAGPAPRVMGVAAARRGVGVTTVTANLGMILAEQGVRVVLVDADWEHGELTKRCRTHRKDARPAELECHILDVMSARRNVHEALIRGPGGSQLLPTSVTAPDDDHVFSEQGQLRLLKQLRLLGRHAEMVLVDVGAEFHARRQSLCQTLDDLLLVTTPADPCLMDTYAAVKQMAPPRPPLRLIVNRAADRQEAEDVFARLETSCARFLQVPLTDAGWLEDHSLKEDRLKHRSVQARQSYEEERDTGEPDMGARVSDGVRAPESNHLKRNRDIQDRLEFSPEAWVEVSRRLDAALAKS